MKSIQQTKKEEEGGSVGGANSGDVRAVTLQNVMDCVLNASAFIPTISRYQQKRKRRCWKKNRHEADVAVKMAS